MLQPLVYFLTLGYGFNAMFQQAGHRSYIQFVVPGVVSQTILFTSIFWGINIMWDKQFGFLKKHWWRRIKAKSYVWRLFGWRYYCEVIQGIALF